MGAPILIVVEQGAVNAERIALEDRAVPERRQHRPGSLFPKPVDQIFDQFHVAPIREDRFELFCSRLEHAEGSIHRTVNDLDVLHKGILAADRTIRNRT